MNMPGDVPSNMEYIQKLFLEVQDKVRDDTELDDVMAFLDAEPPEFRSVAYESASMKIGLRDLSKGSALHEWEKFYVRFADVHSFHLDIGLGWAYAKTETFPAAGWESLHPLRRWMVFDGIGYYHGLFRGRRTIKNHIIPEGIEEQDRPGYDQGIGRRLWYTASGEVDKATQLLQSFPASRHADLWRGVGIACGYVGGTTIEDLELLSMVSGECRKQLCTGIALAAISRSISGSETTAIKTACRVLCEMSFEEIMRYKSKIADSPVPEEVFGFWITHLESGFA